MAAPREVMTHVLQEVPSSIRALAQEAGVTDGLLRQIRDGQTGLTATTRDAVVAALRRWAATCAALADALEAVEVER